MTTTALLVIDMQVGNFSEPYPIYKGNELLAKVKSLIAKARLAKIPIVYVQNNGSSGDQTNMGLQAGKSIPLSPQFKGMSWFKSRLQMLFTRQNCTLNWSLEGSRNL